MHSCVVIFLFAPPPNPTPTTGDEEEAGTHSEVRVQASGAYLECSNPEIVQPDLPRCANKAHLVFTSEHTVQMPAYI